jgi:uncharacterized protein
MTISPAQRTATAVGAIAGLVSGMMGVGGGVVMVPLMVSNLGLTQHLAHGTSLAVMLFTGLASAISYGWQGTLDLAIALELAAGTVVGARIGAVLCSRISAERLRQGFGLLVLVIGLRMIVPLPSGAAMVELGSPIAIGLTIALGVLVGIVSGLMGVGGGIFMVPAMVLLLGLSQQEAQGISLAVIVPTAMSGAYTHYRHNNVAVKLVPWIAVPSILTALVGAYLAHLLPAAILQRLFGLLLLFVGGRMALARPKKA